MGKHNNPTLVGALLHRSTAPKSIKSSGIDMGNKSFRIDMPVEKLASYLLSAYRYQVSSRGKVFIADESTIDVVNEVAACLTTKSEKCGFMFSGDVGNGKTTMMRAMQQTFNWLRCAGLIPEHIGMRIFQAKDIASDMQWPDDFETVRRYPGIALDDIGVEPNEEVIFGNVKTPVIDLLEYRYQNQLFTVTTTNLTREQRKAKYGERIYDRFREMFFNIVFKGESFR